MSDPTPITLLFVDDEPSILSSLKRLFRPHGYQIFTGEGGQAGLDVLEKEHVDLVISDMRMPGMDGAHFLEQARLRWPDTIRILLTGYADIESTIAAINKGQIYRYINKPWDDNEIVLIVREALERRRLEQENGRLNSVVEAQNNALRELNAGLEQKVAERTAELEKAIKYVKTAHTRLKTGFVNTVQAFSSLTEMRGKNLSGHARRVADHARSLARMLELPDAEQQNVLFAALLHDIGKIGLPDALLERPFNVLDTEERVEVMRHPERGQQALMQIEQLRDAALLIRHHHELYNGSGYPDHLAGVAIPLGARILCATNEYDALISGTMTREPMKPKDAFSYLIEQRGKRYDPAVIDQYVEILSEQLKNVIDEIPLRPALLKPGMVLSRDLSHRDGYMLLAKGYVIDPAVITQLSKIETTEHYHIMVYVCRQ
ncbi:MAG: response regulator [Pseudomonadota bacterium]|nr:response regulator [Pseudomonadota bacterium]MDP1905730.1 response regulator [Pseudomonadota bacterium]MDP2353602.1 response regulator [Pseudomonadota bacterium]